MTRQQIPPLAIPHPLRALALPVPPTGKGHFSGMHGVIQPRAGISLDQCSCIPSLRPLLRKHGNAVREATATHFGSEPSPLRTLEDRIVKRIATAHIGDTATDYPRASWRLRETCTPAFHATGVRYTTNKSDTEKPASRGITAGRFAPFLCGSSSGLLSPAACAL